jgi:hypothetical protein
MPRNRRVEYPGTMCPARAKLLAAEDRLLAYPWSSLPLYLAAREHRPKWLRTDRLLELYRAGKSFRERK